MRRLMLVFAIATMSACRPAPSSDPATQAVPTPTSSPEAATSTRAAPSGIAAGVDAPAFVDKVWRVQSSSAGEPGSTYAFLADGTLLIDAPHGTPMRGQWRYDGGKLVMIEEGVAYPTDIVKLDATTFQIRSHNPGGAVDIALVVAPDLPLPTSASVETPAPGSDRDSHGCIPSAGYSWCARTNQCERPWELAKANGFENSREGFDKFCGTPAK
jgi:hypothetical protein